MAAYIKTLKYNNDEILPRTKTSAVSDTNGNNLDGIISGLLPSSKSTYQTTAPTQAIADGGVHIVVLDAEPETKYDGYIYMIKES